MTSMPERGLTGPADHVKERIYEGTIGTYEDLGISAIVYSQQEISLKDNFLLG